MSIGRRTVVRTAANAAWLAPAVTIASAAPAMAACSIAIAPHFSVVAGDPYNRIDTGVSTGFGIASFSQDFTVTAFGGPGTAQLVLTANRSLSGVPLAVAGTLEFSNDWSRTSDVATFTFTRAFDACGEVSVATAHFSYLDTYGINNAFFTAAVTP